MTLDIRIDGGALACAQENIFGNRTVTRELLWALDEFDQTNRYTAYTLSSDRLPLVRRITFRSVWPSKAWNAIGIPFQELQYIGKKGLYIALNQSVPLFTAGPVISVCHGLSFHAYPTLYNTKRGAMRLERLTRDMIARSTYILVSSQKVRQELHEWYQVPLQRITAIPFGIPRGFAPSKRFKRKKIILWVGMPHAIKRLELAVDTFKLLITKRVFREYKLVLAGISAQDISAHPSIRALGPVTQEDLRKLYGEAQCLLVTSYYESFHFPTLEALASQTPVVSCESACIPEFLPYVHTAHSDPHVLADAVEKTIASAHPVPYKKLVHQFSWERYVRRLLVLAALLVAPFNAQINEVDQLQQQIANH